MSQTGPHGEIVLYQFPGGDGLSSLSPPCVRVELALKRLGAPHRIEYCRSRAEARKVSPSGYLPAVEIDGRRLFDSIEILDALEERYPDASLWPRDAEEKLRDRLWEHFVNDHAYYLGYYYRWFVPENRDRMFRAIFARAPLVVRWIGPRVFLRSTRARGATLGFGARSVPQTDRAYRRTLAMVEQGLGAGPYLEGRAEPGRGDLALAATLAQAGYAGAMPAVEAMTREHPALLDHARRVYAACSMKLPRWLRS